MRVFLSLLVVALGVMLDPGTAAGQQPAPAASLRPGDMVRVTVWRKPELSGDFRVLADGSIAHPLYQAINVSGMSMPALTARLREFLATYEQNPQVVVEPMLQVAVGGEVRTPNLVALPVGTTVGQAIAQAGGAGERGNLRKVRLVRDGREQRLDLTDLGTNAATMPVLSGDEIYVGRRGGSIGDVIGPLASVVAAVASIVSISR